MINRELSKIIDEMRHKFPALTLTGPRQSGKTTLLKSVFSDLPYVSLEDIDIRNNATEDPRGFLKNFPRGAVLDEVQRVPDLFSYIQTIMDNDKEIHFVLSGSQNFLMLHNITQSLAGRVAVLKLLPFGMSELYSAGISFDSYEEAIFKGFYPGLYDRHIDPVHFYPSYINTFLEKDVRQLLNINNLLSFSKFLKLCAGRTGQLLNVNSLATDAGVSPNTAKAWLSVLEASYIIYFLSPYHNNFNKRITKSPKLYFYDTGLVCSLLGIESVQQVSTFYAKGSLFENLIINEFLKNRLHKGNTPRLYFWQNKAKQEIDLIVDTMDKPFPFEIKSGMTMQDSYFSNLKYWQHLTNEDADNLNVIYGGDTNFKTSNGNFISWKKLENV